MSPFFKAVRSLIRFAAVGMILIGALLVGLDLLNHRAKGADVNLMKILFEGLLALAGIGLFIGGGKLAVRLTDEDDGDEPDVPPQSPGE